MAQGIDFYKDTLSETFKDCFASLGIKPEAVRFYTNHAYPWNVRLETIWDLKIPEGPGGFEQCQKMLNGFFSKLEDSNWYKQRLEANELELKRLSDENADLGFQLEALRNKYIKLLEAKT